MDLTRWRNIVIITTTSLQQKETKKCSHSILVKNVYSRRTFTFNIFLYFRWCENVTTVNKPSKSQN